MRLMRSALIHSGMKMATGWPSALPNAAKEMPVLPLVASTMRAPGASCPAAAADCRMWSAIRSFTHPVMFIDSSLAYTVRDSPPKVKSMARSGVFPTSNESERRRSA